MSMALAEERVARGAELLDARYGAEWVWRLNPEAIDQQIAEYDSTIPECTGCVLAQLDYAYGPQAAHEDFGSFYDLLPLLADSPLPTHRSRLARALCTLAVAAGFDEEGEECTFLELDDAWRALVERRRSELLSEVAAPRVCVA